MRPFITAIVVSILVISAAAAEDVVEATAPAGMGPVTVLWSLDQPDSIEDLRAAARLARQGGVQVTALNVDDPAMEARAKAFLESNQIALSYNHRARLMPLWTSVPGTSYDASAPVYPVELPGLRPGASEATVQARTEAFDAEMNAY